MESTVNISLDFSGLEKIKLACESLKSSIVRSGVFSEDPQVMEAAVLNELGGESEYEDGPFAGEKVLVPPRPFVSVPAERTAPVALEKMAKSLFEDFKKEKIRESLAGVGSMIAEEQRKALDTNGSNVPGWRQHNEPRTIATKGFDKPLWSRRHETFPIKYEVIE